MNIIDRTMVVIAIILVVCMCIGAVKLISIEYSNKETIQIEVKDKYIKRSGEHDTYMVVDSNNTTYQITDLAFIGKFNSTDIYNRLDIGQTYTVEVTGIRNNFMSWYRNINKIIE